MCKNDMQELSGDFSAMATPLEMFRRTTISVKMFQIICIRVHRRMDMSSYSKYIDSLTDLVIVS